MDKICQSGSDSFYSYFGFKKTSLLKEVGGLELFFAIFTLNQFPVYLKHDLYGTGKLQMRKSTVDILLRQVKNNKKKYLESTFQ